MAVPRTHDGSVGPRSASPALPVVSAVLAVVVVACLVVLGTRYADTSGSVGDRVGQLFTGSDDAVASTADDTKTRELVLSQANQFMIRINTYGPSDLDKQDKMPGYVERVKEVITPKLDVEFEKQVTLAEQSVAQAGLARTIQLYASGAEAIDSDLATVLISGAINQSYPDPKKDGRIEFEPQLFRYEVRLVKTDGTWLVDDFTPVTGEVEGEPTAPVTTPPAGQPSTGAAGASGGDASVTRSFAAIVDKRRAAIEQGADDLDACGFPATGDQACSAATTALAATAQTLANSLRGAANPDAAVFVGAPPAAVADLVQATQAAAGNVVTAVAALRPACVTADAQGCADQRATVTSAVANLVTAVAGWEGLS